jgi:hypothetical protein
MMPHPEELEGFRVKKKESVEILTPGAMKAFFGALDREWLPFSAISAFTPAPTPKRLANTEYALH